MNKSKFSLSLDKIRVIAACLVIMIHTYPLMSINANIDFLLSRVFCRIAVPIFLMTTGYFILSDALKDKKKLINYTKKILMIYLISIIVYLPVNLYIGAFKGLSILELIRELLVTGTFYHLWYFPALILGIWIIYFILKNTKEKIASFIFMVLFGIGLLGDSYYGLISDINILKSFYDIIFNIFEYTRNGLFYVPIFLHLGYLIKENNLKIEKSKNITLLIISIALLLLEGYILHYYVIQRHDSMYLMLIPTIIFLFTLIINNKGKENKTLRNISTTIYITHPLFIIVVMKLGELLHLQKLFVDNSIIHYLLVLILTLAFSYCVEYARQIFKTKIKKTPEPKTETKKQTKKEPKNTKKKAK